MAEIRDRELHRASAPSFEAYIRNRFGLTGRRANQMIQFAGVATEVAEIVGDGVEITERAARPLAGLDDEDRKAAIIEAAADGLTPAAIEKA